jgi:hypothetical protein
VEGSSYAGDFAVDYFLLEDELEAFRKETSVVSRKEKYRSTFGCTTKEAGMLNTQEADGILGLGLSTNGALR